MTAHPDQCRQALLAATAKEREQAMLRLLDGPPLFDVEFSAACNIDCGFCPRTRMARPGQAMPEAVFAQLLQFLPANAVVMGAGLGDALTDPRLPQRIAALHQRGISSCIITNGLLLTAERQKRLIDAGISQVQVSVAGLDEHSYTGIVQRGGDLLRLVAHLEQLAKDRPPTLRVRLNFVETSHNRGQLPAVAALAQRLGFDLDVRRLHSRGGQVDTLRAAAVETPDLSGCGTFAAVTFITAQGDILSCVNDVQGRARLGHIATSRWPEILERKAAVIRGNGWFDACAHCDDDSRWTTLSQGSVDKPRSLP